MIIDTLSHRCMNLSNGFPSMCLPARTWIYTAYCYLLLDPVAVWILFITINRSYPNLNQRVQVQDIIVISLHYTRRLCKQPASSTFMRAKLAPNIYWRVRGGGRSGTPLPPRRPTLEIEVSKLIRWKDGKV